MLEEISCAIPTVYGVHGEARLRAANETTRTCTIDPKALGRDLDQR